MKKNLFNKPSRLSFQTALYAGLGTGIAAIALGLFITRLSLGAGLLAGLLLGVLHFFLFIISVIACTPDAWRHSTALSGISPANNLENIRISTTAGVMSLAIF